MLSNARFNVHVSKMEDKVRFTVVPRSTIRLVLLNDIADLSFVVSQVRPNGVIDDDMRLGEVWVDVQENYRRMDDDKYFVNFATHSKILNKVNAS
jgi:hypothetical protein